MAIEVLDNKKSPRATCPHCKQEVLVDLRRWQVDMSQINSSKCPYCGGMMAAALLILVAENPNGVARTIMAISEVVNKQRSMFLGEG